MGKHTQGPWLSRPNSAEEPEDERIEIYGGGNIVAEVWHSALEWEEYEANARLIAAAPELLAACEEMLEELADDSRWPKAVAAIAKAKGGR